MAATLYTKVDAQTLNVMKWHCNSCESNKLTTLKTAYVPWQNVFISPQFGKVDEKKVPSFPKISKFTSNSNTMCNRLNVAATITRKLRYRKDNCAMCRQK